MPRIDDVKPKSVKAFKKKQYRPWGDLLDEAPPHHELEKFITEEAKNQLVTKKEPIRDALDINSKSIDNQKEFNKVPSVSQIESISNLNSNRSLSTISNPLGTAVPPKIVVSESSLDTIRRLYGLQKKIVFYIVEYCSQRGQLNSGPITNESLRTLTSTDVDTVKTAVQRLIKKGIVKRENGKRGKGGFSCFHITESIRNAVLEEKRNTSNTQIGADTRSVLVTNKVSTKEPISTSSSGSFNINNKTTTSNPLESEYELPLEAEDNFYQHTNNWETLDIEPLKNIGFTQTHLFQIARNSGLPQEVVQESIYSFAFDLEHNDKGKSIKKGNPLNFFMGILRNSQPYAPPANYESPKDTALRRYLEGQREIAQKREALREEAFKLAFENWVGELSPEQILEILPAPVRMIGQGAATATLRLHFRDHVWEEIDFGSTEEKIKILSRETNR